MSRWQRLATSVLLSFFAIPAVASAQSAIGGVVRDTTGAVLPGVTVEASSPALIEKTRSVITAAAGQYRIVDVRPGDCTVTFPLVGTNTIRREGSVVATDTAAQVSAEMKVGAIEETITVIGQTPVVDVQSASAQRTVMSRDVMGAMPPATNIGAIGILVPGSGL